MSFKSILVANRGEIAIRITRAAQDLGLRVVSVFSEDDGRSLHKQIADESIGLPGVGPSSYLNMESILAAAQEMNWRYSSRLWFPLRACFIRAVVPRSGDQIYRP